jgi:quercetin dioxygenase-like cupin family protein
MVPGLLRSTLVEGKSMMVCECTFAPGVKVPNHSHPHEQVGYVASGRIHITIDDKSFELGTGDSYCAPSNVPHSAFTTERSVVVDIFSPPREDYRIARKCSEKE